MPTWSGILEELSLDSKENKKPPNFDGIRRKYLFKLYEYTRRPVILYATKWTQPGGTPPDLISIVDEDIQGIMEVIHGLKGPNLDLILHSPGGSAESAEAIVEYLRSKFDHIRVIVPQQAMSAATMMALGADIIMLGKHSFLGPIDPQFIFNTPLGQRMIPAQAILDQFALAKEECGNPASLGTWLPMLSQYGPDLLIQCNNAISLSQEIIKGWLVKYMFKDDQERGIKAHVISDWLSKHGEFKSHRRHISRDQLENHGVKIDRLEADEKAQDLFLSVFHSTTHTFSGTPAVKIIENHEGKAFINQFLIQQIVSAPEQPPQKQA